MSYKGQVAEEDSPRDAANKLLNAHLSGDVVIILGVCTVNYDGEVWKYLDEERRSIMINPSGAVVVHGSKSVQPKAWQPSDTDTEIEVDDDEDVIITSKTSSDDSLQVRFTDIIQSIHYTPPKENVEVVGSEDDIHHFLIDNPDYIEEGFVPETHEKEISTGRIDIFGRDKDGQKTVVEVKRRKAQLKDIDQLYRYVDTVGPAGVRGILVAPTITEAARNLLTQRGYKFVSVKPTVVLDEN